MHGTMFGAKVLPRSRFGMRTKASEPKTCRCLALGFFFLIVSYGVIAVLAHTWLRFHTYAPSRNAYRQNSSARPAWMSAVRTSSLLFRTSRSAAPFNLGLLAGG